MRYFIMVPHPKEHPIPITESGEEPPVLFSSREAAEEVIVWHPLCQAYGAEIYECPY